MMIDDDPMTDQRKAAIANATNAQLNVNGVVRLLLELHGDERQVPAVLMIQAANAMAQCAQVFATLDLADATREQTAALEAIDVGRRLGR